MATLQVPGVSVAVVQGGSMVYARGYGIRGIDNPTPVTSRTQFMIGSATKPLTTLMMARLVDQRKLSWSTPIVELLSDFALADPGTTQRIQLKHAASNSAGIPHRNAEFVFRHSGITAEARLANLKNMQPTAEVGTVFQYSNFLFAMGGYAAARAYAAKGPLEAAFEDAIRELVFQPLEMNDAFLRPELALQREVALPHSVNWEGGISAIPLQLERACYYGMSPAGAVWSTAPDLAKYLLLELGQGGMPDGTRLVSEEALLARRKESIRIDRNVSYGMGLALAAEQGFRLIYHSGNTLGFSSDVYCLPEQEFAFVVLTNLRPATHLLQAIREKLFELALGAEPKAEETLQAALKKKAWTARINSWVTTDAASMTWVDPLLGMYRSKELGSAHIIKRAGRYWVQFEEWVSTLGAEIRPDGVRMLYQTTPPWCGSKMLVAESGDLVLDTGETKYVFQRESA